MENLAALTQTKTRALHQELVQDVHDGLPKEWKNWKSSERSAADIFVSRAKFTIRLEKAKRQRLEESLIRSDDDCNRRDILQAKFKADHYSQVVYINRKRDYGTSLTVEEQSVWDADQEYEDWVQLLRRRSSLAHAKALSLADPL